MTIDLDTNDERGSPTEQQQQQHQPPPQAQARSRRARGAASSVVVPSSLDSVGRLAALEEEVSGLRSDLERERERGEEARAGWRECKRQLAEAASTAAEAGRLHARDLRAAQSRASFAEQQVRELSGRLEEAQSEVEEFRGRMLAMTAQGGEHAGTSGGGSAADGTGGAPPVSHGDLQSLLDERTRLLADLVRERERVRAAEATAAAATAQADAERERAEDAEHGAVEVRERERETVAALEAELAALRVAERERDADRREREAGLLAQLDAANARAAAKPDAAPPAAPAPASQPSSSVLQSRIVALSHELIATSRRAAAAQEEADALRATLRRVEAPSRVEGGTTTNSATRGRGGDGKAPLSLSRWATRPSLSLRRGVMLAYLALLHLWVVYVLLTLAP